MAVYTARRQQAQDVDGCAIGDSQVDSIGQGLVLEKTAGADSPVDTGVFLVDDPSGAQVQVADFGVAHLIGG